MLSPVTSSKFVFAWYRDDWKIKYSTTIVLSVVLYGFEISPLMEDVWDQGIVEDWLRRRRAEEG
jgi:hypothetical protein